MKSMALDEARDRLAELVNDARSGGEPTVLTDNGRDAAVLVSMRLWEYLAALHEREAHGRLAATRLRRDEGWRGIPAETIIADDAE